jgi:hypothetical protein
MAAAVGTAMMNATPSRNSHDGRRLPWVAEGLPGRIGDISIE